MIFYEVNLHIQNEIFDDYMGWLKPHVDQMLTFDGFIDAKIYEQIDNDDSATRNITVFYSVRDEESLQSYFDKHAAAMRDDGVRKFGDRFSASRRVFEMY